MAISTQTALPPVSRVRALFAATHPAPALAVTALATLLAAEAAPHGIGPVLTAPAMLAGQLSIGWSNDAFDAPGMLRRAALTSPSPRGDDQRAGACGSRPSLAAGARLAMALRHRPAHLGIIAVIIGAAWAYNLGLKSTLVRADVPARVRPAAGVRREHAARSPAPTWWAIAAAALLGLGAHFANVLPDLAADRAAGVHGLPQRVAARWGPGAVRGGRAGAAAGGVRAPGSGCPPASPAGSRSPGWPWPWCSRWLAPRLGRVPFLAAIGIAAIDVVSVRRGRGCAGLRSPRIHRGGSACRYCHGNDEIVAVRSAFPVTGTRRPSSRRGRRAQPPRTGQRALLERLHANAERRHQAHRAAAGRSTACLHGVEPTNDRYIERGHRRSASGRCARRWTPPG